MSIQRELIAADTREKTGIDENLIARLVHKFYDRVRTDEMLGPIFESRIQDWDAHLKRMCAFWSSIVLMTGQYHGQPMRAHLPLPIDAGHFDRWLNLFADTAHQSCDPEAAEIFVDRATKIAQSLELGVAMQNGVLLKKGERFRRI
jgi:hemoglobin